MTNYDVVTLVRNGIPGEMIKQRIAVCEPHFNMHPASLQAMMTAGISEDLIKAMAARQNGSPAPR